MQNEVDEFSCYVSISKTPPLYTFQLRVCLTEFGYDEHRLHCRIVVHGLYDISGLPICHTQF